ncbi:pantoate--beta-alanine ligase [Intestinicryptomonas porci]|uniref:Pantothenate synthetase n=1 Tax=Intestinicryptomonas porci TaxID=2926320 RepID=A0ABU4WEQ6_9BACT|nr:pantoate--beta-alanine ligase [Opitutales bacterium CLA-KB-P66]
MKIIQTPQEMSAFSAQMRRENKKIALVPTMGALHEGHLSLIDIAKKNSDITVVSIFVNPTQFGPNEDFSAYPRQLEEDAKACEGRGVDVVFAPLASSIYKKDASTCVVEEEISANLCGKSRPTHFRGVTTVVAILFNIVKPDVAVFGEKDAQQVSVIKRMVRDLFMDVEIIRAPLVRQENGLALSSRNKYLHGMQLETACRLSESLKVGKAMVEEGCRNIDRVKAAIVNSLAKSSRIRVIYVEIVDAETSLPVKELVPGKCRAAIAVWLDQTRLIDNMVL